MVNAAIFGTVTPGTTYDPEMMKGGASAAFNWEFTTSIQQEIIPRLSARGAVRAPVVRQLPHSGRPQRRSHGLHPFTFTAPADPRLPDGGSYTLTGLRLEANGGGRQSNFVTLAKNYGEQTEHFDGLNITLNARLQNGLLMQGGFGTGREVTNDCDVVDELPETLHTFLGNTDAHVRVRGAAAEELRAEQRVAHVRSRAWRRTRSRRSTCRSAARSRTSRVRGRGQRQLRLGRHAGPPVRSSRSRRSRSSSRASRTSSG